MNRYVTAKELLKKASRSGSRLGLERIYELACKLGDPQKDLKIIHVAGTNGKGSFSAMLSAVLTAQGYKTGMFSSPAMLDYTDQYRINGRCISEELFAETLLKVSAAAESMEDQPTEFELLTAAAFLLFKEQCCDYAVIECGMGGDGDSTNIITSPLLSVITNVALDHCAFLGSTTAEIAAHKAGIIKQGRPVYFGGDDKAAFDVISEVAKQKGSTLYRPVSLEQITSKDGRFTVCFKGNSFTLPLSGTYQLKNLTNVLSCVEILKNEGVEISDSAVKKGLESVRWEGRFETLLTEPTVIFDGAHNPDGMTELCRSIKAVFPETKPAILIGVLADKDYSLYCEMLKPLVCRAFAIAPVNHRALSPEVLSECFNRGGIECKPFVSIESGFEAAYGFCRRENIPLLVIGSLYLYKDIRHCTDKIKKSN